MAREEMTPLAREEMTPLERMTAFRRGQPVDHFPIILDMGASLAPAAGVSLPDYYGSLEGMVQTELWLFKCFRQDSVSISTGLRGMAEAMGAQIAYPADGISLVAQPALVCADDIQELEEIDPWQDGKLPLYLEALQILREKIGDQVEVAGHLAGPFSVALALVGSQRFLDWMQNQAAAAHRVLQIITKNNENYIKALGQLGFKAGLCEPAASLSFISYTQFQEFVYPYLQANMASCQKYLGCPPSLHVCGRSKLLWEDLAAAGCGVLHLGNREDLAEAKALVGDRCSLMGNVAPVDTLLKGTPADVTGAVKACLQKAYDTPCGYILSAGCEIPLGTPLANIEAFFQAGRRFGSWPIQPEVWE